MSVAALGESVRDVIERFDFTSKASTPASSCAFARNSALGSVPQPNCVFLGPLAGCERTVERQDARATMKIDTRTMMSSYCRSIG